MVNFEELKKDAHEFKEFEEFKSKKDIRSKEKKNKENIVNTSLIITNKYFIEQVFDGKVSKFCIYKYNDEEKISYSNSVIIDDIQYAPIYGEEIQKKAILLPTCAAEYGDDEKLDKEIKDFIIKWLDVPEDFLQFAVWNIKRSWVYEKFHTLNYLRALGDTGQGKSRFLDVLGYLHYKPIATSGATTAAPIFRIIDKWHGTLIMDEADFQKSDESQDIIKIINQGYEKGKHIMRCDKENKNTVNFFDPFCPKILATRRTFDDKAIESRCITQVMIGTNRKDIAWNLNDSFWEECTNLRNKLLLWRFRNYNQINPNVEINIGLDDLEPRVQQIVGSFVNLFTKNDVQLEMFKNFIKNYQDELVEERRESFEGIVVSAIHKLISEGNTQFNAMEIINAGQITNSKGNLISPRGLSSTLKALGFKKSVVVRFDEKTTKRCIPLDYNHMCNIFIRYRYDVTVVTVIMDTRKNYYDSINSGELLPKGGVSPEDRNIVTTVTESKIIDDKNIKSKFIYDSNNRNMCNKNDQNNPKNFSNLNNLSNRNKATEQLEEEFILDDSAIMAFIKERGEYPAQEFVEKYGEGTLKRLLTNGDIFEPKSGFISVY